MAQISMSDKVQKDWHKPQKFIAVNTKSIQKLGNLKELVLGASLRHMTRHYPNRLETLSHCHDIGEVQFETYTS